MAILSELTAREKEIRQIEEYRLMDKQEIELKAYDQLCISYHAIDDFRAKLLGILPLITGTSVSFLLGKLENANNISAEMHSLLAGIGVFGILVTLGLFSYELFGIKKCGELIRAGKAMEAALHISTGQFTTRPQNIAYLINEPFAAGVIYPTVLAAWTFFTLAFAWPKANPLIPIIVLLSGFIGTLLFEFGLRKTPEKVEHSRYAGV